MTFEKQENTASFSVTLSLDFGEITLDTNMIESFYFIEDILLHSVTGKIVFNDDHGLLEFGPITGNEQINIVYGEQDDLEWSFNIYKMSKIERNRTTEEATSSKIEIFFVDKMFYPLNFLKFSRSWKDKKITDIVDDISTNMLGITKWDKKEASSEILDYFYMPYWTCASSIQWLLKRATSVTSKSPDFLFYNNSLGTNLVSLETLLSQKRRMTLDNDDGIYVFADPNMFLFNKILDWNISSLDSTSLKSLAGSTNFGYDSNRKRFLINKNTYKDLIEEHTILGTKTLFPDYSESRSNFNLMMEDTERKLRTINRNKWNKLYDKQQTLEITVRGHENRYCGGMIEIQWPSKEEIKNIYNKNLSGFYLVKSITHHFSGSSTPSYLQKMTLIKNGYEESDAKILHSSTKKNIAG